MLMNNKIIFEYDKIPFDKRKSEAESMIEKYPGKIPIIVQKGKWSKIILSDNFRFKFLMPCDQTVGLFLLILKKRLSVSPEQSLFIFVNNIALSNNAILGDVYAKYKDKDGFLKISFAEESFLG